MSMQNLYQEDLLDHYQNPRNFGVLSAYDFISPLYNPSCGDNVIMCGTVQDGVITALAFEGKGCVLSLAMASKLTIFGKDKSLDFILEQSDELVEQLLKMELGPKRIQCGMLSLMALQKGINLYLKRIS